jgi:hypothetical protein
MISCLHWQYGAAITRWTMPNSSGAHDPNFGAIEAAVKETARGRAFLADYARRVRQSDTLTMLAMIGRLERWCRDQAVRLAELEGRDPAFGDRAREGHASLTPSRRGEPVEQTIGRREASLHAGHLDILAVAVCDQEPASVERTRDDSGGGGEIANVRQDREVMDRIEHLANKLHDFDQRAADVSGRCRGTGQFTNVWRPALVASDDAGTQAMISHSVSPGVRGRFSPDAADKTPPLEEDVLDGIAKALGTRKISDDW